MKNYFSNIFVHVCKMDDKYVCDYCTAAFGDITGLEEHIVDHLTINKEDLQVFQDLIRHSESNQKGETRLGYEINSSIELCRSVESQENETSVVSRSSLIKSSESKTPRRRCIPCCICGHALTKHPDIHTKMASTQVLMEHQCTDCSLFFETVESLENHCKEESCKDFNKILQQEVNFSALASKSISPDLSQNEESANQASKDGKLYSCSYKCGKCDHVCVDFNDWLAHEETHMNLQPFHCILCQTNFTQYSSYLDHIEKHRYSNANTQNHLDFSFECKKCHKSFGNAWDLLMHDRLTHIDLNPFRCFACSKTYRKIAGLRYHKKSCYIALFKEKLRQNLGSGEVSKRETIFNQAVLKFQAIFCEENELEKDILCPICKRKEGSFPGLTHHFASHFGFLQCVYCNEPFKKNVTLESHMPPNSKQFACQQCQQSSKDTEILPDLVRKRKKKTKYKYDPMKSRLYYQNHLKSKMLCDTCGVTIKGRQQFIRHIKTHNKPSCTETDVRCPKCNALCESPFQLNMHLKKHHKTSGQIQCNFCQKMLSSKKSLVEHVLRCHSEKEAKFECFECKKKFVSKSELNKHTNIHMSESKPYKCDQCDVAFAQKCNLTKHKIIHTGERPYKCDKCDAAFAHRSNLNKHSHIHTGKYSFRCNICNRGFDAMKQLMLHKKTHSSLSEYLR